VKIERIIISLDHQPPDRELLEAAAELADRAQAELLGLFVENVDLIRFAGLPFACEVGYASAARRRLDPEAMERSLRAMAGKARSALEAAAAPASARWSFRVARGSPGEALVAAATEADLAVVRLPAPGALDRVAGARVVQAGDPAGLRACLEKREGLLVLAGTDAGLVAATLRSLLEREDPR
jgi:nucleotide-binding universal stress UspA family protein